MKRLHEELRESKAEQQCLREQLTSAHEKQALDLQKATNDLRDQMLKAAADDLDMAKREGTYIDYIVLLIIFLLNIGIFTLIFHI